jgi:MFS family permease
MAIATVVAFVIGAAPALSFAWLLGLFFLLTAFQSPLYALGVGQTNDYVDRKDFVPAAAGLLFLWGVGACLGPTLIGFIMEWVGPAGLFLYLGVGFALVALFALYRVFRRRAKTPKEQSDFVPVPNIQNIYGAPELDPRGEFHPPARSPAAKALED